MADVFSFRCFPDLSYLWIHMAYIPVPNSGEGPGKSFQSALAHARARRKRYRKKKVALKAASCKREQLTGDSGKGETAALKELDSVTPQHSEEPASHCVVANDLKIANAVVQQKVASENSGASRTCNATLDSDDSESKTGDNSTLFNFCSNCQKQPKDPSDLKICSKCRLSKYCSRECQAADWRRHKYACSLSN